MQAKRLRSEAQNEFNKMIGANLRFLRVAKKLRLHQVGKILDVRFQQVQKYESGVNAVSAWRLKQFSDLFEVSIRNILDPDYIKKMHAMEEAKFFGDGEVKPKDYFDAYSRQKNIDQQMQREEYLDSFKSEVTCQR
jgi:transcriptional regulator with XRE-family HTH domain